MTEKQWTSEARHPVQYRPNNSAVRRCAHHSARETDTNLHYRLFFFTVSQSEIRQIGHCFFMSRIYHLWVLQDLTLSAKKCVRMAVALTIHESIRIEDMLGGYDHEDSQLELQNVVAVRSRARSRNFSSFEGSGEIRHPRPTCRQKKRVISKQVQNNTRQGPQNGRRPTRP